MAKQLRLTQEDRERLQTIQENISTEPTKHFTIDDLAFEAGINKTKLKDGFKQLFGIPVYEYQLRLRMRHAEALLVNTDSNIKVIALKTGYKTKNSFITAFRKTHNLTPLKWRQAQRVIGPKIS